MSQLGLFILLFISLISINEEKGNSALEWKKCTQKMIEKFIEYEKDVKTSHSYSYMAYVSAVMNG